jgi:hypothetical protein
VRAGVRPVAASYGMRSGAATISRAGGVTPE